MYNATAAAPAPSPCSTRPNSSTVIVGANAAATRPTVNSAGPTSNGSRGPRVSDSQPASTVPTTLAARNAVNGHAYSASASRSATIVGSAVPMLIASKAIIVTSSTRPAVVIRCCGLHRLLPTRSVVTVLTGSAALAAPLLTGSAALAAPLLTRSAALAAPLLTRSTVQHQAWCSSSTVQFKPDTVAGRSAPALGDLLGELGRHLEQVADHPEVGDLEDRRLGVLVHRDDRLRGLHAGPVLDRTGDAQRDVQLRGDRLAGLADLELVRVVPGVDRGPGRADGGAERVGEPLHDREVVRRADAAAAGDDDRGLGELRPVTAHDRFDADDLRGLRRVDRGHLDRLLGRLAAA